MKYVKRIGMFISAIILFVSAMAVSTEAQSRGRFHRPIVIRTHFVGDPFWGWNRWGDPYWGNPYWNNPYYWDRRQKYYDRKSVSDADKKLNKDTQKYYADGYLSPKEEENLAKDREKYDKALDKLHRDRY